MEVVSLIISIVAIVFTIYTYFRYDKKLKEQESTINKWQIIKFKEEENNSKKAFIKGSANGGTPKMKIRVFNAGKAIAKNIRIEYLSDLQKIIVLDDKIFPYDFMNPQDSADIIMLLEYGHVPTIKIKFIWDDDYQKDNEYVQNISIRS
ncbi:MAG: hypothetical protein WC679_04455 [Bacteroidales bacterium]|jgi:hypothetical protein